MELNDNNKLFVSKLSNPISTSVDGHRFEIRVQTLFAILMLSHGRVPGFPNSEIVEIDQQTRVMKWNIDDFMLILQDSSSQKQHRIFFQVKRSFDIGENEAFRAIIRAAYYDFCDERFDRKQDILVLFCGNISCADLELLSSVHDLSEAQFSAESFFTKIREQGFKSEQFRKTVQIIEEEIKDCNEKATDEEVFAFLKCFRIWSVDLHHNDGFVLALMHSFVSFVTKASPHVVWSTVYEYMDTRNKDSGELREESFSEDIKQFFIDTNRKEMPSVYLVNNKDSSTLQPASLINRIQTHRLFKDYFLALLIGGWNEKSEKDRCFIVALVKCDYDSWKRNIIALRHEFQEIITFKNDEWSILRRREIIPLLKDDFYYEDLMVFKEESVKALSEINPEFDVPANTRFYQGKRTDTNYSIILRDSIAETLAIIGNIQQCRNYSYNLPQQTAQAVVRCVLNTSEFRVWGSLNRNMEALAEAAPDVFLCAVEESFFTDNNLFQRLYDEEETDDFLTARNYTASIISALERLAWSDKYFMRAAEIMLKLATCKPGQFNGVSSLNALTEILLPWHPQTFVSADKRKSVVELLLNKNPEVGWRLLLSLLPKHHSSAMNTSRPEFLECSSQDFSVIVTTKEFWDVSEYYLSLAIKVAAGVPSRIMTLADFISDMPRHFQQDFISLASSGNILSLPDEERFPLWLKLTKICAKHRTYSDADWSLPKDSLIALELATKRLKPQKKTLEYLPLFGHHVSDLFPHNANNEESYLEKQKYITQLQEKAVKTLLKDGGIAGLISFSQEVEKASFLGFAAASECTESETQQILDSYLNSDNSKIQAFIESFIEKKYHENGEQWINSVSNTKWTIKERVTFLCALIPITSQILQICKSWLKEQESLYWIDLPPLSAIDVDKECFYSVVDGLLQVGRPVIALEMLGQQDYNSEFLFDINRAKAALLSEGKCNDRVTQMTGYYYQKVLLLVQDSDSLSDDDKALIEWNYLPLLCRPGIKDEKHTPKYLYKKMSLEPAFFCEILGFAYKSTKDAVSTDDSTISEAQKEKRAKKALDLLWNWRIIPEHYSKDHVFCFNLFEDWFYKVVEMTTASGHLEVALGEIGEALFYSPAETDGSLFINRGIADLLDREEYKKLRIGYRCGCFNSRGAYWVDPTAAPELKYAEEYRNKAIAVNDAGYPRFAELLRSIAERYDDEAGRIRGDHGTDDSP